MNTDEKIPPEILGLERFFEALSWARKHQLNYEFMESFLQDYGNTRDILSAIAFANREWDL